MQLTVCEISCDLQFANMDSL